MHPKGARKCRHCGEFFVPDVRNRARHRYCSKVPCRKAGKAASQRRWLRKPENADYFRNEQNAARVREWQSIHPGYGKRGRLGAGPLQELMGVKPIGIQPLPTQDDHVALQDICTAQASVLVGLISHLAGTSFQEPLTEIVRRLAKRGTKFLRPAPSPLQRGK